MKATSTRGLVSDAALGWSQRLEVEVGGAGTVAQVGVVLMGRDLQCPVEALSQSGLRHV